MQDPIEEFVSRTHVEPRPVLPLPYESTGSNPFAGAFRALGVLALCIATLNIASTVLSLAIYSQSLNRMPVSMKGAYEVFYLFSIPASIALNLTLLVGGLGALGARRFAVKLLLVWSCAALVYAVFTLIKVGVLRYRFYAQSGANGSIMMYVMIEAMTQSLHTISAPIVALVLLRNRTFREGLKSR